MKILVTGFIVVGIVLAFLAGLARGFDVTGVVILAGIVAVGALGIAVMNRSGMGTVGPVTCDECGGLISPNAPYCKHCAASLREAKPGS